MAARTWAHAARRLTAAEADAGLRCAGTRGCNQDPAYEVRSNYMAGNGRPAVRKVAQCAACAANWAAKNKVDLPAE